MLIVIHNCHSMLLVLNVFTTNDAVQRCRSKYDLCKRKMLDQQAKDAYDNRKDALRHRSPASLTFAPDQFGQFDERSVGDTAPLPSFGVPIPVRNAA